MTRHNEQIPDPLVPEQLVPMPRLQPEVALALAVLEDGVAVLTSDYRCPADEAWIQGDPPDAGLFAFDVLCETLGLDAEGLRRAVLARRRAFLDGTAGRPRKRLRRHPR